jgi:hypothetical protein
LPAHAKTIFPGQFAPFHATMFCMPASDVTPLPRLGEVFFDVRGNSRTMRLSWYADTGVAVFSIWQGGTCTGTFRVPIADLPRLVDTLQRGPGGAAGPGLPTPGTGATAIARPEPRPESRPEPGPESRPEPGARVRDDPLTGPVPGGGHTAGRHADPAHHLDAYPPAYGGQPNAPAYGGHAEGAAYGGHADTAAYGGHVGTPTHGSHTDNPAYTGYPGPSQQAEQAYRGYPVPEADSALPPVAANYAEPPDAYSGYPDPGDYADEQQWAHSDSAPAPGAHQRSDSYQRSDRYGVNDYSMRASAVSGGRHRDSDHGRYVAESRPGPSTGAAADQASFPDEGGYGAYQSSGQHARPSDRVAPSQWAASQGALPQGSLPQGATLPPTAPPAGGPPLPQETTALLPTDPALPGHDDQWHPASAPRHRPQAQAIPHRRPPSEDR